MRYKNDEPLENQDHFSLEQLKRIAAEIETGEEAERCRECGHTPATGACYYCKAD